MADNKDVSILGENILNSKKLPISSLELSELCAESAENKKSKDIIILDVAEVISIAKYFVLCSGASDRQVKAITDAILENARNYSWKPLSVEGQRENEWVLIDFGSVVVHIFLDSAREFYRIERLFKDSKRIEWREPDSKVG